MPGWIGVDLDGTLAVYHSGQHAEIGAPIRPMVELVKTWLARGAEVRIFTARAAHAVEHELLAIEDWCKEHIGQVLPITCTKDFSMVALFDDRAVQVEPNTGKLLGESPYLR